jgi:hypothetical protein
MRMYLLGYLYQLDSPKNKLTYLRKNSPINTGETLLGSFWEEDLVAIAPFDAITIALSDL